MTEATWQQQHPCLDTDIIKESGDIDNCFTLQIWRVLKFQRSFLGFFGFSACVFFKKENGKAVGISE